MNIKMMVAGLALSLALPSLAVAAEKKPVGSGPNPFTDCGIGAALFPTVPVGAVISNVIWDIGTTAVTSATASPETCQGKAVVAAEFILESYDSLAEETARGQGEHLAALMSILEISAVEQAQVIASVREQMSELVTSAEYLSADKVEKSSRYYDLVMTALNAA